MLEFMFDANKRKKYFDEEDVRYAYMLFLGRRPESEHVVLEKAGRSKYLILRSIILSTEFSTLDYHNARSIVGNEFEVNKDIQAWALQALPLSKRSVALLINATTMGDLHRAIFRDAVFMFHVRIYRSRMSPAFRAFLCKDITVQDHLERELNIIESKLRETNEQPPIVGSLDSAFAGLVTGWVCDPSNPDAPAEVELYVNAELVAEGKANIFRQDLKDLGFGIGLCGFRIGLGRNIDGCEVRAYLKGTNFELNNSPTLHKTPQLFDYILNRQKRSKYSISTRLQALISKREDLETISIIMPMYNSRAKWLIEALESVQKQISPFWELVCIDDASSSDLPQKIVQAYAERDSRIKLVINAQNKGIAASVNAGIKICSGAYVAFLDHDDYLEPDAIYELQKAVNQSSDLIYSDEMITNVNIDQPVSVSARPAFSYDYYLSHPYFVHLICVNKHLAIAVGGWNEEMSISADVDFVLRVLEKSRIVTHIPKVLYRWRTHPESTGHAKQEQVMRATIGSLNDHLKRTGRDAVAVSGGSFNVFHIKSAPVASKATIIIPTKNNVGFLKPCVESIYRTTSSELFDLCIINHASDDVETLDYLRQISSHASILDWTGSFNFAAMHNAAVARLLTNNKFLLFMNNDIEAIDAGWFEEMQSLAARRDVGAVGATLLYRDDTIQHAGVIIGMQDGADHAFKFQPFHDYGTNTNAGYLQGLISLRECSAVTAACMMIKTEHFRAVGGFDERLAIGFNDTDLCLKLHDLGLRNLNTPRAVLHHYESATRIVDRQVSHPEDTQFFHEKWRDFLHDGDPYYNPQLNLRGESHVLAKTYTRRVKNRRRPGLAS
jgi:GT2 family glycosyltransferase